MSILGNNLYILQQRQPDLAKRVWECAYTDDVVLFPSLVGPPTMEVKGRLMHSAHDPVREARRWVDIVGNHATENVAFLGCGMGYHIVEYMRRENWRDMTIIIEPNLEVFRCWLETMDLTPYIVEKCMVFAVALEPVDVGRLIQSDEMTLVRNGLRRLPHAVAVELDPDYFAAVDRELHETMTFCCLNNNTRREAWFRYARNAAVNIAAALHLPGVAELKGKFKGIPAFVVAAGPSLNKNIDVLKRAQGRSVILAVGTVAGTLLAHGITPDFTVIMDYGPDVYYRHLANVDTSRLRILVDPAAHPTVLSEAQGERMLMDVAGRHFTGWSRCLVGDHGGVEKGLTVAHTCFLLAVEFGCSPITLVGQDLAFTDGYSHAQGTAIRRTVEQFTREEHSSTILVEGNDGAPVVSDPTFMVYRKHFEALIDRFKEQVAGGVINATEGGAKIGGTTAMPLEQAIAMYCNGTQPIARIIRAHARLPKADPKKRKQAFKTLLDELRAINQHAKTIKDCYLDFITELAQPTRDITALVEIDKKHMVAVNALDKCHRAFAIMAEAICEPQTIQRDRRLHPHRIPTRPLAEQVELVKLHIAAVEKIAVAARFWIEIVNKIKSGIRRERGQAHAR